MPAFYRFAKTALAPLIAFNCAGMMLAGGFIIYSGYWGVLWNCLLGFFISPLIFPFLMIPAAFCGGLMRMFLQSRPLLARMMQAASIGWLIFVISFWAAMVFDSASPLLALENMTGPALLWSVCGAMAPWAIFVHNDRDNVFLAGLIVIAQIGCIAGALASINYDLTFWSRFAVIAGVMAALSAMLSVYEEITLKKKSS